MRAVGFSTGALALGDVAGALRMLAGTRADAVELSALRERELVPLVSLAGTLDLSQYRHVSVHAPSGFPAEREGEITELLTAFTARGWPVVVHPDVIWRFEAWRKLGALLYVENMDRRKPIGRTAAELQSVFDRLPDACLCFDIAHARLVRRARRSVGPRRRGEGAPARCGRRARGGAGQARDRPRRPAAAPAHRAGPRGRRHGRRAPLLHHAARRRESLRARLGRPRADARVQTAPAFAVRPRERVAERDFATSPSHPSYALDALARSRGEVRP